MSKLRYILLQLRTKLWLKPTLTGLGAVVWVELALASVTWFRFDTPFDIDRSILLSLLQILASTMLTVAIFAVSAMVAAFSSVSTTATPRAMRLVMQDGSTQNALAAFLSAFIYAIVALVAVSAIRYEQMGRFMLFIGYVLIVFWVLFSFVRWVDQVSKLGRMQDTITRVEEASRGAFEDPLIGGTFGAREARGAPPDGFRLTLASIGQIQHIDVAEVQKIAESLKTTIRVLVRPGAFIDRNRPVLVVPGHVALEEPTRGKLERAFTIGTQRHLEADPRCGLVILAEIADRALSPAVNDPGTAITVLGSQLRLVTAWVDATREETECKFDRVEIPPLSAHDLLEDALSPIERDGAGMYEVGVRLQKTLRALYLLGHRELSAAAELHSRLALEQALPKLGTAHHREKLQEIAKSVGAS